MPLTNRSTAAIYWRAFDPTDRTRGFGRAGFEGTLPVGGSVAISFPLPNFQLEVRDLPPLSLIPPSRVLVAAGPPNRIGQVFSPADVLSFDGITLRRETRIARAVNGVLPSRSGFRFANSFPPNSYHGTVTLLGQTINIGDAANGLCGGMVYAVRDYHQAQLVVPNNALGPVNGVLFDYLVRRLWDSFSLPLGWTKYLQLMDPALPASECARITINEEWPKIRADIDAGVPSPIGLILVRTSDPLQVGHNHQVLVHGYSLDGSRCRLSIYDPNEPGRDDIALEFELAPSAPNFRYRTPPPALTVHAFFRHEYAFSSPPRPEQVPGTVIIPPRSALIQGAANLFDGNGWLGLMRIQSVFGTSFSGTLYGQTMDGSWDEAARTIQFRRQVGPGYDQLFAGRFDPSGVLAGTFREVRNGATQPGEYAWRAVSSLLVEGNGWQSELMLTQWDVSGPVAGQMYGDSVSGGWDRGTQQLSLTRRGSNPNYAQSWTGQRLPPPATSTPGEISPFAFAGEFREIVNGAEQAQGYRWSLRERPAIPA